ncbi:MAG: hypothetical protein EXS08_14850 [Planctomycetes bacterium]|nr:hypothetical protein [Planctomycetota bacterium]
MSAARASCTAFPSSTHARFDPTQAQGDLRARAPRPRRGSGAPPAPGPSWTALYMQAWVKDAGAVQGWAASNALSGTTN